MLLLVPMLVAIVAALVSGGSLRNLAALPLRALLLILVPLLIEILIWMPSVRSSAIVLRSGGAIYVGALALAVVAALANWHLGMAVRVATLGVIVNALVIAANGGHMPVNAAFLRTVQGDAKVREMAAHHLYENTQLATTSSRLTLLSDTIPVPLPGGHGNVYSIGDVLIAFGIASLAYRATRRPYAPVL